MNDEPITLENNEFGGVHPPAEIPEIKWINVNGRKEHEAMLKDHVKMESLGLDPHFEIMVYLKRWGGFLRDDN